MVFDKIFALLSCINTHGCLIADGNGRADTDGVSVNARWYLAWLGRMKGVMSLLPSTVLFAITMGMVSFSSSAQVEPQWQDISGQLSISLSNPIRSRRSPDAKVIINMTNNGSDTLLPPARLIIRNLLPSSGLTIEGASTTNAGEPMLELSSYLGEGVAPGVSLLPITLNVLGGGSVSFGFDAIVENQVTEPQILSVEITIPESLMTVGASPLPIQGTISDSDAVLTVNGAVVAHSGGLFSASVSLDEGNNTVVARVVKGSAQTTDSIIVSLDTTPPYITLESHVDGQTVFNNSVTVTGLINDIVRGTVESTQANVTVNGMAATVSNRSYAAMNVPLSVGNNIISILSTDQVGNVGTFNFALNYEVPQGNRIELVSGQDQISTIGSQLASPLIVRVVDGASQPIPDTSVVLRVMQGSGVVGVGTESEGRAVVVNTDSNGQASTSFKLGARVGSANQKVRARVVGIDNEVVFNASATGQPGNKLSINSGNNQRGVVGQSLPAPLVTVVTDEGANVVAGARVRYDATVGDGHFGAQQTSLEVLTDSDGRAAVSFVLGDVGGLDAQRITATLVDVLAGQLITAGFTATGFVAGEAGQTTISGIVLDNQDVPIPGVTLRVDGSNRQALSNEQGQFVITESPIGPVHLIADGSTATIPGDFPALSYNLVTISGVDNPLSSPIYMVKLNLDNSVLIGASDVELTLDEYPGFKLEVAANSVTFPDGSGEGSISVTPVNTTTVPMAPPNGMQPQFIVTIQPTGTLFDPPARLSLPNFDGHAPGAQVEMYSFDHDLEEFVAIGLGSVSEDGSVVRSNPGVGVIKAGWHCGSQPGGQGCTHNCPVCQDCDDNCNCVITDNDPRLDECQTCKNGMPVDGAIESIVSINDVDRTSIQIPLVENGSQLFFALDATADVDCQIKVEWEFSSITETTLKKEGTNVNHTFEELGNYAITVEAACENCEISDTNTLNVEVALLEFGATTKYPNLNDNKDRKYVSSLWTTSRQVDLKNYLSANSIREDILWYIDDVEQESSILNTGSQPSSEEFTRFDIELRHKEYPGQVFDNLMLLILPENTQQLFDDWYATESADSGWLAELPALYSALANNNGDPEPACEPELWEASSAFNGLLHPNAAFEMRSNVTANGHGHQATYNETGNIITSGVSAGTADRAHKSNIFGSDSHYNVDVRTFIWAMHLDANPVDCDFRCLSVSGEFVLEDINLTRYLSVRPPVANSRPMLVPLMCQL